RPTQSPIVFLQQLGRGLRKAEGKDYVIVLDFIANYKENYLIPIALSGDRSYDKDTLRRFVAVEHRFIPGASTIEFDAITKEKIFQAIDVAQTQSKKLLRQAYKDLKFKLGHIPTLNEFEENNSIDAVKYFDVFGSYYAFLCDSEPDFKETLPADARTILKYFSSKLGRAQRISEVLVLQDLLDGHGQLMHRLDTALSGTYHQTISQAHRESVIRVLTNQFCTTKNITKANAPCVFIEKDGDGDWKVATRFAQLMQDNPTLRDFLSDLASFMKHRFERTYAKPYEDTAFVLYEKYSYEDVCRLLNWEKNVNGQNIGGYKYDEKTKTLPVFINYKKNAKAISYEDHFRSRSTLIALSKTNRRVNSKDAKHIYKIGKEEADNRIFLFMRRDKNDKDTAKYFYFLGEIKAQGTPVAVKLSSGKNAFNAFKINYDLKVPVRQDLYDYLTTETQI
ncbi:MAG TPA: NgoFVII family restriction endonuclease, partial [Sutterella sp.]|nr:NgoFVII family restriction endonuclease [Sutterella sp.]